MKKISQSLISMLMSSQLIANPYYGSGGTEPKPFDPYGEKLGTGSSMLGGETGAGTIEDFDHGTTGTGGGSSSSLFDAFPIPDSKPFDGPGSSTGAGGGSQPKPPSHNDLIIDAIKEKKSITPICLDHIEKGGFNSTSSSFKNVPEDIFQKKVCEARKTHLTSEVKELPFEYSNPLEGLSACQGGFEKTQCYQLLSESIDDCSQSDQQNLFNADGIVDWFVLQRKLYDPIDPRLTMYGVDEVSDDDPLFKVNLNDLRAKMPEMSEYDKKEIYLSTTSEIIAAIDYQAAYGEWETVFELHQLLRKVNPKAAIAVECLLGDLDKAARDYQISMSLGIDPYIEDKFSFEKSGPLTGIKYETFNEQSLVGAVMFVPAVIAAGKAVGAWMVANPGFTTTITVTAITAGSSVVNTVITANSNERIAAADRQVQKEIEEAKIEIEKQKIEIEKEKIQLEKDKQEHNGKEGNNQPGTIKEAPTSGKSDLEKNLEASQAAAKEGQKKSIIGHPDFVWLQELEKQQKEALDKYNSAVITSQHNFGEGKDFTSLCSGVYEGLKKLAHEEAIYKGQIKTVQDSPHFQDFSKKDGGVDFEYYFKTGKVLVKKTDKQLEYCSKVYIDGGNNDFR